MSVVTTEMQDQVTELYITYFGRAPDAAGFAFWTQALANGATVMEIGNDFAKSPEFVEAYGGLTPEQQVNSFYQNTLNRDADAGGLEYWSGLLKDGASFTEVAYAIVNTAFVGGEGVAESDTALVKNKVAVGKYFALDLKSNDGDLADSAFDTVTADEASVAATEDMLATEAAGGTVFDLTTGHDDLTGNSANNTFDARVVQNVNGEQTNQLATGDQLNGGGGTDTLNAKVISASALNDGPAMAITPETVGVEVANFTALTTDNVGADELIGAETVEINAKYMNGVDVFGSVHSDASLLITNATTLTDNGVYADKRLTKDMTVRMDHSGNDAVIAESDMTVLFDNDYLLREGDTQTSAITVVIQPLINAEQFNPALPLNDNPYDQLTFLVDGVAKTINITTGTPPGPVTTTYAALGASIQSSIDAAALTDPSLDGITVTTNVDGDSFFAKDGTLRSADTFTLSKDGATLRDAGPGSWEASAGLPSNNAFGAEIFEGAPLVDTPQIEIDVQLEKVGRGSDGGALTIGGMATDLDNVWDFSSNPTLAEGIEKFNIEVSGDASQFSSLSSLQSTNNTLESVTITSAAGSEADLIIGNKNTAAEFGNAVPNDADNEFGDPITSGDYSTGPTGAINNALKDVRDFDSTLFANDVEVHGYLSNEVVAKYMDLTDDAADAAVDNANFEYLFGAGNDTLNLNLSKANLAAAGTATREDFDFTAHGGSGNDTILLQIGNGIASVENGVVLDHWFQNALQNANLGVVGGDGNDTILTYGSGMFEILAGAGNDVVMTDNSGALTRDDGTGVVNTFNDGRATFVLNAQNAPGDKDIDDLLSNEPSAVILDASDTTVTITYLGYEASLVVANTDTVGGGVLNDYAIRQTIKGIINNDEHLSDILIAQDGPAGTLIVNSLIDGVRSVSDLQVSITTEDTDAGVQTLVSDLEAAFQSALAQQLSVGTGLIDLAGANSSAANVNAIEDGAGADTIVLSSNNSPGAASESIDFTVDGELDVVINFGEDDEFAFAPGVDVDATIVNGGTMLSVDDVDEVYLAGFIVV